MHKKYKQYIFINVVSIIVFQLPLYGMFILLNLAEFGTFCTTQEDHIFDNCFIELFFSTLVLTIFLWVLFFILYFIDQDFPSKKQCLKCYKIFVGDKEEPYCELCSKAISLRDSKIKRAEREKKRAEREKLSKIKNKEKKEWIKERDKILKGGFKNERKK
jgi:hypothetical protein